MQSLILFTEVQDKVDHGQQQQGMLTARRNRRQNATQLRSALLTATGRRMSTQTVHNRLHGSGLNALKPMVCTRLTPQHRTDHRNWVEEHRGWRHVEWRSVPFPMSRDSTWNLIVDVYSSGGNKGYEPTQFFLQETSPYGGDGLMV